MPGPPHRLARPPWRGACSHSSEPRPTLSPGPSTRNFPCPYLALVPQRLQPSHHSPCTQRPLSSSCLGLRPRAHHLLSLALGKGVGEGWGGVGGRGCAQRLESVERNLNLIGPLLHPVFPLASLLFPPTLALRGPFSENMAIHGLPWLMRGQGVSAINSADVLSTLLIFWSHFRI